MKKGCLVGLALLAVPVGIGASFLAYRRPWVEPLPDVDMTPELGILLRKDVVPGSATDRFLRTLERTEWGDHRRIASVWGEVREGGWPPDDPEAVGATMEALRPLLDDLHAAVSDPTVRTVSVTSFTEHWAWISHGLGAGRLLGTMTIRALAEGEWDDAFAALDLQLGLARALGRGGPLIDWLVAIVLQTLAVESAAWLPESDAPAKEVQRWIRRMTESEADLQSWPETLRQEMYGIVTVAGDPDLLRLEFLGDYTSRTMLGTLAVLGPLRGSHPAAIRANLMAAGQHAVRAAEEPDDPKAQRSIQEVLRQPDAWEWVTSDDPVGRFVAMTTIPILVEAAPVRHRRGIRALWGTAAMLAVHLHEREHGGLPEDLAALTPATLPETWPERLAEFGFRLEREGEDGWAVVADPMPGETPGPPLRWAPVRRPGGSGSIPARVLLAAPTCQARPPLRGSRTW